MQQKKSLTILLEVIWWVATAILAFALVFPIIRTLPVWPFLTWNILFIIILVTFTRYIFLLPYTFLAKKQVLKIGIILALFPITFLLISELHSFMEYVEEKGWDALTGMLAVEKKRSMESYIWGIMIFFGAGSVVAAPVLAGRLFLSVWRTRNRGTV